MDAQFKKWLTRQFAGQVRLDEPMSRHTSFGVGGPADVFIEIEDILQLQELVAGCTASAVPYLVLAGGTNLLVKDRGVRGVVIDVKQGLQSITRKADRDQKAIVEAEAGVGLQILCRYAIDNGLAGMNFAVGIPGTVGGAVIMNAGAWDGSMADVVEAVQLIKPDGNMVVKEKQSLAFAYRGSCFAANSQKHNGDLIASVCFAFSFGEVAVLRDEANRYLKNRMQTQPKGIRSAGCFFKNPETGEPAGKIIDRSGMKGQAVGGASISESHANFILAHKEATAADVLELMALVQNTVADRFGVYLEPEVIIVGE